MTWTSNQEKWKKKRTRTKALAVKCPTKRGAMTTSRLEKGGMAIGGGNEEKTKCSGEKKKEKKTDG